MGVRAFLTPVILCDISICTLQNILGAILQQLAKTRSFFTTEEIIDFYVM
jgi:hypothetical protein